MKYYIAVVMLGIAALAAVVVRREERVRIMPYPNPFHNHDESVDSPDEPAAEPSPEVEIPVETPEEDAWFWKENNNDA